ncbi:CBS domain-containing protein [Halobacterium sp. KA-4]|jgi:CBS domain-containing protein|uniref:CBS domain-containing protein n=1 Tax=Halobacterium sp. KA-4 TaxID=2896367 RepID=UPI001E518394|nr:CBS domain-containing protein [Halobacterium sp. KA-4]MCD2198737.1 CBS domain-containing protein [Halobacterium sp. KA-4]
MRVRDVMSTDVLSAAADESVRDAVGRMLDRETGSVVVEKDSNPAGILTKVDVMEAGHEHDRPLSEIPVYAAASRPLITVEPSATVSAAAARMFDYGIHHLPAADGLELVGIVTATDLLEAQDDLLVEARGTDERRDEWED